MPALIWLKRIPEGGGGVSATLVPPDSGPLLRLHGPGLAGPGPLGFQRQVRVYRSGEVIGYLAREPPFENEPSTGGLRTGARNLGAISHSRGCRSCRLHVAVESDRVAAGIRW